MKFRKKPEKTDPKYQHPIYGFMYAKYHDDLTRWAKETNIDLVELILSEMPDE